MVYIQDFELGVLVEIIVKNITLKQCFKHLLATVAFHTLVSQCQLERIYTKCSSEL